MDMELSGDEMIVLEVAVKRYLRDLSKTHQTGLDKLRKFSDKITELALEAGPAGYKLESI